MKTTTYRIFVSSPGDVRPERERAEAVVARLNSELRGSVRFELSRWEDSYYAATSSFQAQISHPSDHDIVLFVFWKRLGTELPAEYNRPDGTGRTGTEYEFEEALEGRERRKDGLPEILVYRKTAPIYFGEATVDQERAEKRALDAFWSRWFHSGSGHFVAGFNSFRDTDDFARQLERHLKDWLKRRSASVEWDVSRFGSPFRGLESFEERHAGLFFGREDDIARARARLIESAVGQAPGRRGLPTLLILGASGSGKSSLLRAGLIPVLRPGVPAWSEDGSDRIDGFRVLALAARELGLDPVDGLCRALFGTDATAGSSPPLPELAQGDHPDSQTLAEAMRATPGVSLSAITRALDRAGTSGTPEAGDPPQQVRLGLLLVLDQLEELFTVPAPLRDQFVRVLETLVSSGRVWVVAAMRNDYYDRLRADAHLSELFDARRTYDLHAPSPADFRAMIRRPAAAAGLQFESDGERDLAAEIEAEANSDGSLPMIEFLLQRLFETRRGDTLALEVYDQLGGAAGVLASAGEAILGGLDEPARAELPRIVRRLVRKGSEQKLPTARAVRLSEFPEGTPARRLIEALREGRLVQTFAPPPGSEHGTNVSVRFAHEALLVRWPRIAALIRSSIRDYETLDRVEGAQALWLQSPAELRDARLLSGLSLREATEIAARWGDDLSGPVRSFVAESARAARQQRTRRWVAAAAGAVLAAALGAVAVRMVDTGPSDTETSTGGARAALPVVSVMVPQNLTGDPTLEWLGQGIVALVRDELARSRFLIVAAPSTGSSRAAASPADESVEDRDDSSHELSAELLNDADGLLLTVRMVNTRSGVTVVADRFRAQSPKQMLAIAPSVAALAKRGLGAPTSEQVDIFAADFAAGHVEAYEAYVTGLQAFLRFDYGAARTAFESAVAREPAFAIARYRLAHTLAALGDSTAAMEEVRRAARDSKALPDREQRYISAAEAYFARDYAEAERRYEALLERYPYDLEARQLLVYVQYDLEKFEQALDNATMLSIQQPQSEVTWGAISELNLKLGRLEDADRALQRYLQVSPENPNAYLLLGERMFLQRRYEEAVLQYALALERNPTFAAPIIRTAHVEVLAGNYDAAVARLRQVAEDDRFSASERLTATFDLVNLLRAQDRCDEAEALLARRSELIRREEVRSALALAQRSRCALDAGRVAEARRLAAQAVEQSLGPPTRYLVARGLAEIEARDYAAVDATIASLRQLATGSEPALADVIAAAEFLAGVRAMADGDARTAVSALSAATASAGYPYELYGLWQSRALLQNGERAAAVKALTEAAAARDPADPRLDLETSRKAARALLAQIEAGALAP